MAFFFKSQNGVAMFMFLDLALIPYKIILFDFILFLIQCENLQYVSTYPS